ncbi:hypothetical protein [uncultured Microscilla sp.]|uniref:hypothetical protein n=1 Tax=uncultured Microscilla sp. TaxID=432653 RepID=UPI002620B2B5|nr:hypothetical protein [uncultured Microscilla sp.]
MKYYYVVLLLAFVGSTGIKAQSKAKTPAKLLKKIYQLVETQQFDKLKNYLYQGSVKHLSDTPKGQDHTIGDMIIEGIKNKKDQPHDFGYNAHNLKLIIDKHLDKIKPIPQDLKEKGFGDKNREFGRFPDLYAIAKKRPKNIYLFQHKQVAIIMVKFKKKGVKLVFWENLGAISKANDLSQD